MTRFVRSSSISFTMSSPCRAVARQAMSLTLSPGRYSRRLRNSSCPFSRTVSVEVMRRENLEPGSGSARNRPSRGSTRISVRCGRCTVCSNSPKGYLVERTQSSISCRPLVLMRTRYLTTAGSSGRTRSASA